MSGKQALEQAVEKKLQAAHLNRPTPYVVQDLAALPLASWRPILAVCSTVEGDVYPCYNEAL